MGNGRSGRRLYRLHFAMIFVWAALAVPTVLLWSNSVLWVALISVYANIVSHASAWQASRAERTADPDDHYGQ